MSGPGSNDPAIDPLAHQMLIYALDSIISSHL